MFIKFPLLALTEIFSLSLLIVKLGFRISNFGSFRISSFTFFIIFVFSQITAVKKIIPMKRMGKPKDLEEVVKFLLNDNSRYVTGQNILIDGGRTVI